MRKDRPGGEAARLEAEVYESQHLVGDREREEPSTPILEASAVADQRKTEEMMGGGEESGTGADARCGKVDERGRNGEPESKEATATKDEETDTLVGSTASGMDEAKSTDTKVGEERNPSERGTRRGAECETCNAAA